MRVFEVADASPEDFVDRVAAMILTRGLAEYVSVALEGDQLLVSFRWMGTSRLHYRLEPAAGGFRATLTATRLAPVHAPFRGRFEGQLESVLSELGARLEP